jgi:hypothetical protein
MAVHRSTTTATTTTAAIDVRRVAYAVLGALLLALLVFELAKHGNWAPAVVGALGPDVALLFGAGAGMARGRLHPRAVRPYNALHRFWAPLALVAAASLGVLGLSWFILGLAWALHISLDRSVGYGLRDADGFQRVR